MGLSELSTNLTSATLCAFLLLRNELKVNMRSVIVMSTLVLGVCQSAQAANWSLGAGALVSPDPYVGYKNKVYPVPMIGYEGKSFYFRGFNGGYYLWNDESDKVALTAFYSPIHFRAKDSSNHQMKRLDNRYATVMGGISWTHTTAQLGSLRTVLAGDMLGNSNGITWDNTWIYHYQYARWRLSPGVGIQWNSANHNDYYYGVSRSESSRSGMHTWDAGSSWNPYVELSVNYSITPSWSIFGMGRYVRLGKAIKDSPMVDNSWTGVLLTGVNYRF